MQMTSFDIVKSYREAKDKTKQVRILADLNACSKSEIIEILKSGGVSTKQLPRVRKNNKPQLEILANESTVESTTTLENDSVHEDTESCDKHDTIPVAENPYKYGCGPVEPIVKKIQLNLPNKDDAFAYINMLKEMRSQLVKDICEIDKKLQEIIDLCILREGDSNEDQNI